MFKICTCSGLYLSRNQKKTKYQGGMKHKTIQRNNYKIAWSRVYEKWQVKTFRLGKWVALEEFRNQEDAIAWALNN